MATKTKAGDSPEVGAPFHYRGQAYEIETTDGRLTVAINPATGGRVKVAGRHLWDPDLGAWYAEGLRDRPQQLRVDGQAPEEGQEGMALPHERDHVTDTWLPVPPSRVDRRVLAAMRKLKRQERLGSEGLAYLVSVDTNSDQES